MKQPCMCGADDCKRCFPSRFVDGVYVEPVAGTVRRDVGRFRHLPPANKEPAHPLASYYCDKCGKPDWVDTYHGKPIREFYKDQKTGESVCNVCINLLSAERCK